MEGKTESCCWQLISECLSLIEDCCSGCGMALCTSSDFASAAAMLKRACMLARKGLRQEDELVLGLPYQQATSTELKQPRDKHGHLRGGNG